MIDTRREARGDDPTRTAHGQRPQDPDVDRPLLSPVDALSGGDQPVCVAMQMMSRIRRERRRPVTFPLLVDARRPASQRGVVLRSGGGRREIAAGRPRGPRRFDSAPRTSRAIALRTMWSSGPRRAGVRLAERRRRRLEHVPDRLGPWQIGDVERQPIGEQPIQQDAEGVDVAARVDFVGSSAQLLGAHVRQRAHQLSVRGLHRDPLHVGAGRACDAEVEHLRAGRRRRRGRSPA